MTETAAVPGRGWYLIAGLIVVAALAAAVVLVAWFVLNFETSRQFLGPGKHVAEFDKPGSYVVWNDYRTVFGGRSYDVSEKPPSAVRVRVRDAASGHALDVAPSHGASSSVGDTARKSVAKFEITKPGRYEIVIEGDFPQRVFSANRDFLWRLFLVIFGVMALLFVGFGLAIGILCWVFIKREEAREAEVRTNAPAGAPASLDAVTKANKNITRIVYILQLASLAAGITFIAAVILNYVKRKDVEGTWLESHFRWQIHTFWYYLLWMCVGLATLVIVVGFFVLIANVIWMLFRAIKGISNLDENKPMPE